MEHHLPRNASVKGPIKVRDGMRHQQQATFRNNTSDFGTLWQLQKVGWAWCSRSARSCRRTLGPVFVGVAHILTFTVASIVASRITMGNEALISRSDHFGLWVHYQSPTSQINFMDLIAAGILGTITTVITRVRYCEKLAIRMEHNQRFIPFKALCLGSVNASIYVTTGLVDSLHDLGFDGKDEDRVTLCSPFPPQSLPPICPPWISYVAMIQILNPTNRTMGGVLSNQRQWATAFVIIEAFNSMSISQITMSKEVQLLAESLAFGAESLPPVSNQWVLDAQDWFAIALALAHPRWLIS
ncbi:uncharacterized protein PAC_04236 [Phialocephala subalpina]|uniref:Uncharacterized protein n=1 Tax=Phialocephala subalpina TaxID=576137 RepID=A0A1L7WNK7_9HELO|nr:uncharacterized protein PAC_04236 [Phialocephala subalpina]